MARGCGREEGEEGEEVKQRKRRRRPSPKGGRAQNGRMDGDGGGARDLAERSLSRSGNVKIPKPLQKSSRNPIWPPLNLWPGGAESGGAGWGRVYWRAPARDAGCLASGARAWPGIALRARPSTFSRTGEGARHGQKADDVARDSRLAQHSLPLLRAAAPGSRQLPSISTAPCFGLCPFSHFCLTYSFGAALRRHPDSALPWPKGKDTIDSWPIPLPPPFPGTGRGRERQGTGA